MRAGLHGREGSAVPQTQPFACKVLLPLLHIVILQCVVELSTTFLSVPNSERPSQTFTVSREIPAVPHHCKVLCHLFTSLAEFCAGAAPRAVLPVGSRQPSIASQHWVRRLRNVQSPPCWPGSSPDHEKSMASWLPLFFLFVFFSFLSVSRKP